MTRREKIEERLKSSPDDVFLNYTYAMELTKLGAADDAWKVFQRVRQLDPEYVSAYFQEGQLLAGEGKTAEARSVLQAGIQVARSLGDSHALGEMTDFLDGLE